MIFRPWKKEDLDAIAEMEKACFSEPWSRQDLENVLKFPFYRSVLAEEEGQVCGYACLIVLFETVELGNIAVDPRRRKQGIGSALLEAVHGEAKGLGGREVLLEVRRSNLSAISLYEKFGYKKYGIREHYYGDEDAILMRKEL